MKRIIICFVLISICFAGCKKVEVKQKRNPYGLAMVSDINVYKKQIAEEPKMELINLGNYIKDVRLDIRYATNNNFTNQIIYNLPRAFARKQVAQALSKVQDSLAFYKLGIKIYDAYRPYEASLRFFDVYPDTNFVANPRYGSRHNRGCAIDLTLVELKTGKEIPMPTEFDDFSEKANPNYKNLSDTILKNRAFLFSIMNHFGFSHNPSEWWHFDYKDWNSYPLMDIRFDELELLY